MCAAARAGAGLFAVEISSHGGTDAGGDEFEEVEVHGWLTVLGTVGRKDRKATCNGRVEMRAQTFLPG